MTPPSSKNFPESGGGFAGAKPRARTLGAVGLLLIFGGIAGLYLVGINADLFFSFWPDQTEYLIYALAYSRGLGYSYLSVDPAIPMTIVHPPGFPFFLSLAIRGFGLHIPLMKFLLIVIFLAGIALYADLIRRRERTQLGWWAGILALTVPFSLAYSQLLLSEFPFFGLSIAVLWAGQRAQSGGNKFGWWLVSAVLAIVAFYFRVVGIALLGSLVAALLLSSSPSSPSPLGRKPAMFLVGLLLAGLFSWFVYDTVQYGRGAWQLFYDEATSQKVCGLYLSETVDSSRMISSRIENLAAYVVLLAQMAFPWIDGASGGWWLGMMVILIIAVGFVSTWRNHRTGHELYFLFYWPVILLWSKPEQRYLIAIYPLLFYFLLRGLGVLGKRIHPRLAPWLPRAFAVAALAMQLDLDLTQVIALRPQPPLQNRFRLRPLNTAPWLQAFVPRASIPVGSHFRSLPSNQAGEDLILLELWARDHLPPTSKIAVNYFNDCYLISGLKAASILDLRRDPVQVLRENPVNYVFVAEAQPIFSRWAREAIRQEPRRFVEIFRVPETETAIYQYQPNAFP